MVIYKVLEYMLSAFVSLISIAIGARVIRKFFVVDWTIGGLGTLFIKNRFTMLKSKYEIGSN